MEDGFILVDRQRVVKVFNPIASAIFGVPQQEAIGRRIDELFPHISEERENSSRREWTIKNEPTQPVKYVDVSISQVPDVEAQDTGSYIILARDVTLKRTREQLAHCAADMHSNVLAAVPVPIFYTDADGNHLHGSAAFYKLIGSTHRSVREFLPDAVAEKFQPTYNCQETDVMDALITVHVPLPDRAMVQITKNCVYDSNRKHIGFVCSLAETTMTLNREISAALLMKSLNSSSRPTVISSWPLCRVSLVNDAFVNLTGFSRQDLIGRYVSALTGSRITHGLQQDVNRAFAEGRSYSAEFEVLCTGDRRITSNVTLTPVRRNDADAPSYCILTLEN